MMGGDSTLCFTRKRPCPVCGGHNGIGGDQGRACHGFLAPNRRLAHCTRVELAGHLELAADTQTYPHLLSGRCACGERHDGGDDPPPKRATLGTWADPIRLGGRTIPMRAPANDSRLFRVAIAGGIGMRRDGRRFKAVCAFHHERTPSMQLDPAIDAYHCFGCGASGGYVALAKQLGVDLDLALGPLPFADLAPRTWPEPTAPVSYDTAPARPPRNEVEALLLACGSVYEHPEVAAWLRARALDPATIEDRELARALPTGADVPDWAHLGRLPWSAPSRPFPLVLPLYGETGESESVRARALTASSGPGRERPIKAVAAAGASMRGLVMADPLARCLLQGDEAAADRVRRSNPGVVIAEGEPDFLSWATMYGDAAELAPAVFGVVAGSWPDDCSLAARIPDGAIVLVATHHDDAGQGYADKISASLIERALAGRVELRRNRAVADGRAAS